MIRRKEIHHQRVETEAYFEGLDKSLFRRLEKVGESLDQVSSWKEIMLRNKNESIKKNIFYYVFLKTYWLALAFDFISSIY